MPKRLLVPIDESQKSAAALDFAVEEWPDADVTLLHVIDPLRAGYDASTFPSGSEEWYKRVTERADELFEEARERTGRHLDGRTEVGRPASTIVSVADEGFNLVVVGSHGREGVARIFLGSVAEHVARRSPVSVLIVR